MAGHVYQSAPTTTRTTSVFGDILGGVRDVFGDWVEYKRGPETPGPQITYVDRFKTATVGVDWQKWGVMVGILGILLTIIAIWSRKKK